MVVVGIQPRKPLNEFRLHVYFQTDAGFEDTQMREVFKARKPALEEMGFDAKVVDDRLLLSNQVHYVAAVQYEDGTDPLEAAPAALPWRETSIRCPCPPWI